MREQNLSMCGFVFGTENYISIKERRQRGCEGVGRETQRFLTLVKPSVLLMRNASTSAVLVLNTFTLGVDLCPKGKYVLRGNKMHTCKHAHT